MVVGTGMNDEQKHHQRKIAHVRIGIRIRVVITDNYSRKGIFQGSMHEHHGPFVQHLYSILVRSAHWGNEPITNRGIERAAGRMFPANTVSGSGVPIPMMARNRLSAPSLRKKTLERHSSPVQA